jgi:hypothetical protein
MPINATRAKPRMSGEGRDTLGKEGAFLGMEGKEVGREE